MVISMCNAHCKFFLLWVFPVWAFHFYGRIKSYTILFGFCQLFCTRSNPPSSHLNARRYFGRMLSCRQFEYFPAWEYCDGFSFSRELKRRASFIPLISFHGSWSRKLLDWIMGLVVNCQPPPFHLNARRYFGRILSCISRETLLEMISRRVSREMRTDPREY